jgi:hypothetical protein
MRIFITLFLIGLFASCSSPTKRGTQRSVFGPAYPDAGSVVQSAASAQRFYMIELDMVLLKIPDGDTLDALKAKMHCGHVEAPVIHRFTQHEEDQYTVAPNPHPKLRVMQATMPSQQQGGTVREITLPTGWDIDDSCTYPYKYSQDHYKGFSANMTPHLEPDRQWVVWVSNYGGGICSVFLKPHGTKSETITPRR